MDNIIEISSTNSMENTQGNDIEIVVRPTFHHVSQKRLLTIEKLPLGSEKQQRKRKR